MLENFPKSLVTSFDCGDHSGCSSTGDTTAAGKENARRQIGTWQGGVVVDPVDPKLKAHFVAQLERKYTEISNFQGTPVIALHVAFLCTQCPGVDVLFAYTPARRLGGGPLRLEHYIQFRF
jgi:hypothetical protein